MSARWVVVLVAYAIVMICNFTVIQSVAMMADQLNGEKRSKEFLSPIGWRHSAWERQRRIVREYRAAHPEGNLYGRMVASYTVGAIGVIVVFIALLEI